MEQTAATTETVGLESTPTHQSLWRIAWRRKSLVALGVVVGLVLGGLYYAQKSPVYQSTAQVLVIKKRPDALPLSGADPRLSYFEDYLSTHVTLIKSQLIVDRAVQKEHLQGLSSLAEEGNATNSIIKWLSVARDRESGGTNNNILNLSFRSSQSDECSRVLNAVINSYKDFLDETYKNVSDETVKLITQARDVLQRQLGEKQAAYVEFRKQSPLLWKSKDGINLYQARLTDIEARRSALQVRRAEIQGRLRTIESALKAGRSPVNLMAMVTEWSSKLRADRLGAEVVRQRPGAKDVEDQLLPLLLEEEALKEKFGPDYPQLKSVRRRIELARALMARQAGGRGKGVGPLDQEEELWAREAVEGYIESLKQELEDEAMSEKTLADLFERESSEARKLAAYEIEDASFTNELTRIKQLYDGIIKRLEEVGFTKDFGGYDARIISPAARGKKVEPRAALVFGLALFLGLVGGLGMGYLAEITDKSFRTPEEIRRRLGLPIVGYIPLFSPDEEGLDETVPAAAALDATLRTFYQSKSAEAEAYRSVRTALYFSVRGEQHKIIQITSPTPGDGKTTLAANLAISMAQSGKRLLLIDADFRKPCVHKKFGISNNNGLSLALAGETELSEAIQETSVPGLWILPCGPLPYNPAELLTSPRLKEFLDLLREQYDFVLVDTPPLLAVTDPSVVAPRVDGVLLTIRVCKNSRPQAERAKEILTTLGVNVLGVVVNGFEDHGSSVGYAYQNYSYSAAYHYADSDGGPQSDGRKEDNDSAGRYALSPPGRPR
jgi:capsular exopolysaccharide synthesis family protein